MWRRRQQNDRTRRRLLHTAHVPVCFLECVAWRGAGVSPSAGPHLAQTLAAAAGSRQASLESLECPSISPPSRCSCTLLPHQPPPPPDSKRVERVKRDKRDKSEEKANREQEAHTHTHTQSTHSTCHTQQSRNNLNAPKTSLECVASRGTGVFISQAASFATAAGQTT